MGWKDDPVVSGWQSDEVVKPEGSRARAQKQSDGLLTKSLLNLIPGAVRGSASIGNTLMLPFDAAVDVIQGRGPMESNDRYRREADEALRGLGADPSNIGYKGGKLLTELAGTAGVGGAAGNALARLGAPAALSSAVGSAGFTSGGVAGLPGVGLRAMGGALTGGMSAGLVDPRNALMGAAVGGAAPMAVQGLGVAGNALGNAVHNASSAGARRLMQSAIKPTLKQLKTGDADVAVRTMLDHGISPNQAGVEKLRALIDAKNQEIAGMIGGSSATVDKATVLNALGATRQRFGNQVSPTADLGAIQRVADDFVAHPTLPGATIPVQAAQELKQGTYRALGDKYGQLGSAETEAQKALARGLKDEIAKAVPGVGALNAEEAKLLTTLSVAERRALMEMNKNPMGLASLASNPVSFAAFMADKSAAFKALAARALNSAGKVQAPALLTAPGTQQLLVRSAPVAVTADR
jgi:hypothetical protein